MDIDKGRSSLCPTQNVNMNLNVGRGNCPTWYDVRCGLWSLYSKSYLLFCGS
jgi:hypothetical protein